jgi:hypothetical protein
MSNLLDKSSIVLTPTAYDNGKVLCVKPSDGSGDFDFSRNSAATRVNAQGLVEDVQILSSDLVQNGSFSQLGSQEITNGSFSQQGTEQVLDGSFANGDADWNRENSVFTISDGVANGNGANGGSEELSQNFSQDLTAGKTYKIVFELLNYVSGSVQFALTGGGSLFGTSQSADGTFTQYVVALGNNNKIKFRGANFNGSITSISLVEVGQDWVLGTGTTISGGNANFVNANSVSLYQNIGTQSGFVKVTFSVTNYTSGTLNVYSGGNQSVGIVNVSANALGDYVAYVNRNGGNVNIIFGSNDGFIGSVTNISVKEVGQNWNLGTGWSIGDDKAISDGTINTGILQNNIFTSGKLYKISFDVDVTSGTLSARIRFKNDFSATTIANITESGSYTFYQEADRHGLQYINLSDNTATSSITNIKIIEITDDTNLPRINYEGFSYQDALGSEEITNGDFLNGTNNWQVESSSAIVVGDFKGKTDVAKININNTSTSSRIRQPFNYVNGKTYKVDIEVYVESGNFRSDCSDSFVSGDFVSTSTLGSWQTLTANITAISTGSNYIWLRSISGISEFYISKVSVKEVTGQEVVPDSGCGSWLWEPQSTNLIPYSELFSNSAWGKTSISVLSNVIASPSGEINASKIVESNTSGFHFISDNISVLSGANTFTFYSKAAERTQVSAFFSQSGNVGALFDLTAETATPSGTGNTANIESVGNGWYRCIVSNNGSSQISNQVRIGTNNGALGGYQGDGTSGLFIWGAQVEQQTYPTSYIPTSGQASGVTRNQDLCIGGGSAASMNSSQGVLYAEIAALVNGGTGRWISISDGTTNNRVSLAYENSSTNIRVYIKNSGGVLFDFQKSGQTQTNFNKIAVKYKVNDFALWVNGVEVASVTSGTTYPANTLNSLQFNSGGGSSQFFGKTKALAVFPFLTDTELQELTTI